MRALIATFIAAAALAAVPVVAVTHAKLTPDEKLEKLLKDRVAGKPQSCITLNQVSDSQIIDKTAIVYRIGNTYWVNRPRNGAEALDDDDVMVVRLSSNQLCSIDTIELHYSGDHFYKGFVSLGEFVPYRRADSAD